MKKIFLMLACLVGFNSAVYAAGSTGEKLKWTEDVLKEFKASPESKGVLVSLKNPSTVMISNLARTINVDLERGEKSYIYFLNRKELNLKDFRNQEEVNQKISALLPKIAAYNSFWLGKVWAQGGELATSHKLLRDAISQMLNLGVASASCEQLRDFDYKCNNFAKSLGELYLYEKNSPGVTNSKIELFSKLADMTYTDIDSGIKIYYSVGFKTSCYKKSEFDLSSKTSLKIEQCLETLDSIKNKLDSVPNVSGVKVAEAIQKVKKISLIGNQGSETQGSDAKAASTVKTVN